jgi:dTDP-4-amino-4,6-dideoxyglucose
MSATAKAAVADLALFGGKPLFGSPRPIGQLDAPDVEEYLAALRESYDARHLSNDGPLVKKLEKRLAQLHEVRHAIALANAGLGLTMLMQYYGRGRTGEVIMPAFSYRGLPHFCQWAGQKPRFVDVDRRTHFLDPRCVAAALSKNTTSVLGVCNFNDPGDIDGVCAIARAAGVPVFLDSVYAVGSTYRGRMLGGFTDAEVYSLHATKLLNGFEGGYITTNDDELAAVMRWQRNFALPGIRPTIGRTQDVLGLNAKLNELHAAMALLSVERMDATIGRNRERFEAYRRGLSEVRGLQLLPYAEGERANYQMAVVETLPPWPLTRDQTVRLLRAEGAAISAYYSPPLHRSEHCPAGVDAGRLPVSEDLALRFVQLPVGELTTVSDVKAICQLLELIAREGAGVKQRIARMEEA